MKQKNKHAAALGRMSRGKPKNFSSEELKRRAEQMKQNQRKRWHKIKTVVGVEIANPDGLVKIQPQNSYAEYCKDEPQP